MNPKRELSQYHEIRPTELALELAKQEKSEGQRNKFKNTLIDQIKSAYKKYVFPSAKLIELPKRIAVWQLKNRERQKDWTEIRSIRWRKAEEEAAGASLDPETEAELLRHANGLKFYFDYGGIENFENPKKQTCPGLLFDLTYSTQNLAGINEQVDGTIQTALWPDLIPFEKILEDAASENPEGAISLLQEIVDEEQGRIEELLRKNQETVKELAKKRREMIQKGEPAGEVLVQLNNAQTLVNDLQIRLNWLLQFVKQNGL